MKKFKIILLALISIPFATSCDGDFEELNKDPNNPELQYNLGVISSEIEDFENSKKYYLKAIELKPNYTNAYLNLAALILGQEESILDEMNALGSSAADDRKYDKLKLKRNQLYLDAIPHLEKFTLILMI